MATAEQVLAVLQATQAIDPNVRVPAERQVVEVRWFFLPVSALLRC